MSIVWADGEGGRHVWARIAISYKRWVEAPHEIDFAYGQLARKATHEGIGRLIFAEIWDGVAGAWIIECVGERDVLPRRTAT